MHFLTLFTFDVIGDYLKLITINERTKNISIIRLPFLLTTFLIIRLPTMVILILQWLPTHHLAHNS